MAVLDLVVLASADSGTDRDLVMDLGLVLVQDLVVARGLVLGSMVEVLDLVRDTTEEDLAEDTDSALRGLDMALDQDLAEVAGLDLDLCLADARCRCNRDLGDSIPCLCLLALWELSYS